MKTINMKKGFTMIELVFVIVIIGILSAVALPKFLDTANQAHDSKIKAFEGTLNRTVGPTLWAKSLSDPAIPAANKGQVATYCGDMATYTDIPSELTSNADCTFDLVAGSGATLEIKTFVDGDATKSPKWTATVK